MTNNNLEEVILKYTKNCGCKLKYCEHYLELRDTIEDILTKKDQEHKAELEMIKEEIEKCFIEATESDNGYETGVTKNGERISNNKKDGYNYAIQDTLAILDSHINKLSTE